MLQGAYDVKKKDQLSALIKRAATVRRSLLLPTTCNNYYYYNYRKVSIYLNTKTKRKKWTNTSTVPCQTWSSATVRPSAIPWKQWEQVFTVCAKEQISERPLLRSSWREEMLIGWLVVPNRATCKCHSFLPWLPVHFLQQCCCVWSADGMQTRIQKSARGFTPIQASWVAGQKSGCILENDWPD